MKTKIIFSFVAIALLLGIGIRSYIVTANAEKFYIITYNKGEYAALEKNFFDKSDEVLDGYSVSVVDSWIVNTKDFLKQNNEREDLIDCENIYMVKLAFLNDIEPVNEETGINLEIYSLLGKDYLLTVQDIAFKILNPEINGGMRFSLRANKPPFEITVPFAIYEDVVNIKKVEKDSLKLQVCAYPQMKLMKIE